MTISETIFTQITQTLTQEADIELGKMMSSPGLKYQGRVFAFFHKGAMTFKLGEEFAPEEWGLTEVGPLSPFKTKPPLKGWLVVQASHQEMWPKLADTALDRMKMGK